MTSKRLILTDKIVQGLNEQGITELNIVADTDEYNVIEFVANDEDEVKICDVSVVINKDSNLIAIKAVKGLNIENIEDEEVRIIKTNNTIMNEQNRFAFRLDTERNEIVSETYFECITNNDIDRMLTVLGILINTMDRNFCKYSTKVLESNIGKMLSYAEEFIECIRDMQQQNSKDPFSNSIIPYDEMKNIKLSGDTLHFGIDDTLSVNETLYNTMVKINKIEDSEDSLNCNIIIKTELDYTEDLKDTLDYILGLSKTNTDGIMYTYILNEEFTKCTVISNSSLTYDMTDNNGMKNLVKTVSDRIYAMQTLI